MAWAISCAVLGALILLIGDLERAGALLGCLGIVTVVLAIWVPDRTSAGGLLGESPHPARRPRYSQHTDTVKGIHGTQHDPTPTVPEWAVVLIAVTASVILFVAITAAHRVANRQR